MAFLLWNSAFSVNVKEIDAQHQKLVEILNLLHEAMLAGKGSLEISKIVDQMVEYSERHFTYEEKILADQQYPGFLNHHAEHEAFIRKANEFKQNAAQKKLALSVTVSSFLKDWLTTHIQVEDKKYSAYLNARGIT